MQRYQAEARVERVDGLAMVKDMAEEMENMMADKIDAIKVMDSATLHLFVVTVVGLSWIPEFFTISSKRNMKKINKLNPYL